MPKCFLAQLGLVLGLITFTPTLPAHTLNLKKADDAVRYRQSAFALLGVHFSSVGAAVRGKKPFNAKEVAAEISLIDSLADLPWKAFGPGTDGGNARSEIWKKDDEFKAGVERLKKDIAGLNEAGKSGQLDDIKKAYGDAARSCKACHDNYKKKH
jgi:cytochrome c556